MIPENFYSMPMLRQRIRFLLRLEQRALAWVVV
jgi:hypothetical protein